MYRMKINQCNLKFISVKKSNHLLVLLLSFTEVNPDREI